MFRLIYRKKNFTAYCTVGKRGTALIRANSNTWNAVDEQANPRLFSLLAAGFSVVGARRNEEANYRVLAEDGAIQIRLYRPMLLAKTEIEADYAQAGKIGFNRLAAYIFGRNAQKQELAMTTPVFREEPNEYSETQHDSSQFREGHTKEVSGFC